jgi:hypothetical protein
LSSFASERWHCSFAQELNRDKFDTTLVARMFQSAQQKFDRGDYDDAIKLLQYCYEYDKKKQYSQLYNDVQKRKLKVKQNEQRLLAYEQDKSISFAGHINPLPISRRSTFTVKSAFSVPVKLKKVKLTKLNLKQLDMKAFIDMLQRHCHKQGIKDISIIYDDKDTFINLNVNLEMPHCSVYDLLDMMHSIKQLEVQHKNNNVTVKNTCTMTALNDFIDN